MRTGVQTLALMSGSSLPPVTPKRSDVLCWHVCRTHACAHVHTHYFLKITRKSAKCDKSEKRPKVPANLDWCLGKLQEFVLRKSSEPPEPALGIQEV